MSPKGVSKANKGLFLLKKVSEFLICGLEKIAKECRKLSVFGVPFRIFRYRFCSKNVFEMFEVYSV